jgi:hypothetical protein
MAPNFSQLNLKINEIFVIASIIKWCFFIQFQQYVHALNIYFKLKDFNSHLTIMFLTYCNGNLMLLYITSTQAAVNAMSTYKIDMTKTLLRDISEWTDSCIFP